LHATPFPAVGLDVFVLDTDGRIVVDHQFIER
jgi:hypothetical protein